MIGENPRSAVLIAILFVTNQQLLVSE